MDKCHAACWKHQGLRMDLKLVLIGDPILRQTARKLTEEEIRSPYIQELITSMRATMHEAIGVGLAAPQVGEPLQLIVLEDVHAAKLSPEEQAVRKRYPVPFQVIINPVMTVTDATQFSWFESCLSVGGHMAYDDRLWAIVPRNLGVRVSGLDQNGSPITIDARGWHARILQHEIEHVFGRLYIDSMNSRSMTTKGLIDRYWKDMSMDEVLAQLNGDPIPKA